MADRLKAGTSAGQELLEISVTSDTIGGRILVYSSCIPVDYPDMLERFKGYTLLRTCLTSHDLEKTAWKLLTIARMNRPVELAALTMDGSPHCIQLHFALEDIRKVYQGIRVRHFVIEKGVVREVSGEAVDTARHLSRIEGRLHGED
jgi:hypothetical protein